ncbi:MAG TPA: S8 family serine peptidase, partial [Acidimicrobiales bacterium]
MTSVTRTSAASVLIAALLASSVAAAVYQQHANAEDAPREQIAEQMAKEAGSHTMVRVAAGAFDPLDGVPAVPASLRAPAGSRYALVQVEYPSTAAVQDAMRAAGAELLGVLPDVTYVVRADAADLDRVRDIEGVRWVGPYHPAYKLAPGVEKVEPGRRLRAWPHAGIDGTTFAAALRAVPGVSAVTATKRVTSFEAPASALAAVARIDDVQWVEVAPRYELHNRNALWVTDTGERDKLAATAPGRLDGTGQTAAVADTGVNYIPDDNARAQAAFSDCNAAGQCKLADYVQATPGDLPAELATVRSTGQRHRKMAGYFNLTDDTKARSQEGSWHGTHVSGSVAADYPDANGGYGTRNREADGIAVGARLVFQDVESEGGLGGLPESPYDLFNQVYDLNKNGQYDPLEDARTHNNSYGAIYPEVDAGGATDADAFIRDHPDMTVVFSAANSGPDAASLAGGPQVSKNTITSCASANGRQPMVSPDSAASFSSHGPTLDGRVKPDVCTPGQINVSPKGGTVNEDHYLQGTSMSGPMLVGLVTLVRQYFWDGYGPAGTAGFARGARSLSRRHNPSAALVKAVTINSAQRMRGVYTGDDGTDRAQDGQWPSSGQGWGKVELDKSLYFEGDDRGLYAVDVPNDTTNGFATGQQVTHFVDVAPGQPLDISLTWTDPASALGAGTPTLVNDLDLTVTAPNGTTTYLGNEFTTQSPTLGPGG